MWGYLVVGLMWLACVIGWVANIFQIVAAISNPVSVLIILKIVGMFAFPIGAILGFVGMF